MSNPEYKRPPLDAIIGSVVDHAMLVPLYSVGLILRPRVVLQALRTQGVKAVYSSYIKFYDNMRPILHLGDPKK